MNRNHWDKHTGGVLEPTDRPGRGSHAASEPANVRAVLEPDAGPSAGRRSTALVHIGQEPDGIGYVHLVVPIGVQHSDIRRAAGLAFTAGGKVRSPAEEMEQKSDGV